VTGLPPNLTTLWVPACAGMTVLGGSVLVGKP
jgi:hypothetical protein